MKTTQMIRKQAQAGFTLIELIVVIVILGILAATALPRMFDMSGQARLAKMQAALGAVKAASASAHAQWLVSGGQLACATCGSPSGSQPGTTVIGEGKTIVMLAGYPDVGGDGLANAATVVGTNSGIIIASGLSSQDYDLTTLDTALTTPVASKNNLTVAADSAHPKCRFTYIEGSQTDNGTSQPTAVAPSYKSDELIPANCN
ncbi:type II secretion system protein [Massilia sp. TWP1-3-3]|uniref:type II secretion system protein n=1 Tax=Massilia sp. TWP1-3-3 TaxID=2804573 RepID=UPI003CFAF501